MSTLAKVIILTENWAKRNLLSAVILKCSHTPRQYALESHSRVVFQIKQNRDIHKHKDKLRKAYKEKCCSTRKKEYIENNIFGQF